jgi:hypothetical protein
METRTTLRASYRSKKAGSRRWPCLSSSSGQRSRSEHPFRPTKSRSVRELPRRYDGLLHFLMSPEDIVPVLARWHCLPDYAAQAMEGGRHSSSPEHGYWAPCRDSFRQQANGSAVATAASFLLLGGLLAADARLSLRVTTAIAAALSLYHDDLNGTGAVSRYNVRSDGAAVLSLYWSHLRRRWWRHSDRGGRASSCA